MLKSALNHVAADPEHRIQSRQAWENGFASIPNAETARNIVLAEEVVRQIVADEEQPPCCRTGREDAIEAFPPLCASMERGVEAYRFR